MSSWTSAAAVMKPTERQLLAGRQAETEGDVGLAGPTVAERDEVLAALDVLAAGQLQDQRLVERGDDLEVKRRLLTTGKRAALMRRSTMRRSRSISSSSASLNR